MAQPSRGTALVTGASSGIGLELVTLLARDRHDLVFVARSRERLEAIARGLTEEFGVAVSVLARDLAQAGTPAAIARELEERGLSVDILINNAGFGVYGPFAQTPLSRELEMIEVNVTALTQLTKLLLPGMLARRRGRILNVASTAAFQPGPLMAVYYATKAYVVSFTEALAEELAGSALRVSCLCPGPTATGFAEEAHMTESRLFRLGTMNATDVARIGYNGWKQRRVLVVPGIMNRFGVVLVGVSPRSLVRRLIKRLNT